MQKTGINTISMSVAPRIRKSRQATDGLTLSVTVKYLWQSLRQGDTGNGPLLMTDGQPPSHFCPGDRMAKPALSTVIGLIWSRVSLF